MSPVAARPTTVTSTASDFRCGSAASRPAAQAVIDRHNIGPGEQPGPRRLMASAAAPSLGHHPPAGRRHPPRQPFPFHQCHDVTSTALHRKERPGVQHLAAP
jgi:hypothetical protein